MKNDPFFAFTAAVVLAGVVASFTGATAETQPSIPTPAILEATAGTTITLVSEPAANPLPAALEIKRHGHRHAVEKS